MLHVLSGEWPFPGEAVQVNPNDPNDVIGLTEFCRREEYVNKIGDKHVLMQLIRSCLSNSPSHRPTSTEVHQQVSAVAVNHPPSFSNKLEMLERIKVLGEEKERIMGEKNDAITERDAVLREKDRISATLEESKVNVNNLRTRHRIEVDNILLEVADLKDDNKYLHEIVNSKDQQLASKDGLIASKSKTIQCLQDQLGQALKTQAAKNNINVFSPGVKLIFTPCTNLPVSSYFGQAIVGGGCVYVGLYGASKVLKYNSIADVWSKLPDTPVTKYSIGHLDKKLLLVGGQLPSKEATPNIYEFDESSQTWLASTSIPPMPTARSSSTTISWTSPAALIVCGGRDHQSLPSNAVEVYHSKTSQWFTASPLPAPRDSATHAIVNNTLYLIGGYEEYNLGSCKKTVMSVSIPHLLESCFQPSGSSPVQWWSRSTSIPDVPYYCCTATSLGGCLLAIGGSKSAYDSSVSSVYAYCPLTSSWVLIGELPEPLCDCIAASLPTGELLVLGGWSSAGMQTSAVYKLVLI